MAKIFYFMKPDLVTLYGNKKDELIQARSIMTAEEAEKGKAEILKESRINDIGKNGEIEYSVVDGIAIIPITGMLCDYVDVCMAWFDMNVTTYRFIRQSIIDANNDPLVKAIILDNNSGGGFVSECEETFKVILNSEKPVFSIVHDLAASADYWLPSAGSEIIVVSKTAMLGSIGVAMEMVNYSDQEKKEGIKRITLTNDSSKKKRPDELTKEGKQVYIDELNAYYNVFADSILIKRNKQLTRKKIDDLEGIVLISDDAINYGLADTYMLQQDVIPYIKDKMENNTTSFVVENKLTPKQGKMEDTMPKTLKELLAENPDVKAEFDNAITSAKNEGVEAGKNEMQKRINATANYIGNKNYPGIESLAKKVLTGEYEISALEGAVIAFDMLSEKKKSDQAKLESNDHEDVKPENILNETEITNAKSQEDIKKAARYA